MYYRRWTRMHLKPGMKYFMKYGVLNPKYDKFAYLMSQENPDPLQYKTRRVKVNKDKTLDTKLIENLFLKYPDLKFEPISHTRYPGTKLNTFSYAFAFINEQKKLIKQGYTTSKAFQITQEKYHQKMKRKLDQSLLSRGLAIGNRARSFLNIYQQQSEFEARLKTQRSQRQLEKYELKLKSIRQAVQESEQGLQSGYLSNQLLNYNRTFYDIKPNSKDIDYVGPTTELGHEQIPRNDGPQRIQFVNRLETRFKHLFNKFYEHAATKDRLQGLTDSQIINQIQSSPMKLKRQMKELITYFHNRNIEVSVVNGKIMVNGPNSQAISNQIRNNNYFKIGFLSETLNYEKPVYSTLENPLKNSDSIRQIFRKKNSNKEKRPEALTNEQKDLIKDNKRKQLQLVVDHDLFYHKQAYKVFETQEERLLRLQIKYYDKLASEIQFQKGDTQLTESQTLQKDKETKQVQELREEAINTFRRLKLRLQTRYKNISAEEFLFGEHETIKNEIRFENDVQYEELIGYLRKKSESRRLTSLDQSNDTKINKTIRIRKIGQAAVPQGQKGTRIQ